MSPAKPCPLGFFDFRFGQGAGLFFFMRLYGTQWPSDAEEIQIELACIERGGRWEDEDGYLCGKGLFHHFRRAWDLMWPEDDEHRWSLLGLQRMCEEEINVFMGPGDCVRGDTRILNPFTGEQPTIQSLCEAGIRPVVMTLNGPEVASVPYLKGHDWLYEVVTENGAFTATARHRVLTSSGFAFVGDLQTGQCLRAYESSPPQSSEVSSRAVRTPSAACSRERFQDSQGGYHPLSRSCDGLLHSVAGSGQASFQPQGDAPRRIFQGALGEGAQGNRQTRILADREVSRLSIADSFPQDCQAGILCPLRSFAGRLLRAVSRCRLPFRLRKGLLQHLPFGEPDPDSFHTERLCNRALGYRVQETTIKSICRIGFGSFYDLTVPKAGHYFAEGTIHHNSNKTFLISKFVICHWWASPYKRLWLCSSTDKRGAELRIWGKIKEFYNRARARFPWLPGRVLESKACITPDEISDDQSEGRLLTRGIIFIPCKQGNTWIGLGPYAGIKPPSEGFLGHAGDEVSLMAPSFLDAYANWYGKANFKGLLTGNPGDLEDPLCKAGEPVAGWDDWKDSGKTQEWRSRFYNAWVVAFDGRDTPNNDFPYVGGKPRYHYLIGQKKLEAVKEQYGENDWHWWNQCVGKPQASSQVRRVITRQLVRSNKAMDDVIWASADKITQIVSLDAAYGGVGGDRCVIRLNEFGPDVEGNLVFACSPPDMVPVNVRNPEPPEVQIARYCKTYCQMKGVEPSNFFFDGRSTLAIVLAQEWSPEVNVVDFGGAPTSRPVSNDEWIWEGDEKGRRLKRCDEEYFNFVSELWFAAYHVILCKQMRRLDRETVEEGYQRTWGFGTGTTRRTRKQVEPKPEMKERTKRSPDLFDCLVTGIEGARRRGFEIQSFKGAASGDGPRDAWLEKEVEAYKRMMRKNELRYAENA